MLFSFLYTWSIPLSRRTRVQTVISKNVLSNGPQTPIPDTSRREFSASFPSLIKWHELVQFWRPSTSSPRPTYYPISTQSSSAHVEERDQELWGGVKLWGTLREPRVRLSLIRFTKCFRLSFRLVHSRLHESGWTCGVSEVWACFSVECWSKHDRPILHFSDSKTTFARLIRQN